jgi:hypothetical protein
VPCLCRYDLLLGDQGEIEDTQAIRANSAHDFARWRTREERFGLQDR